MSDRFNFERFRERINSPARDGLCAWIEDSNSHNEKISCCDSILEEDDKPVIKWLLNNDKASELRELPSDLYIHAFCLKHVCSAIDTFNPIERPTSPTTGAGAAPLGDDGRKPTFVFGSNEPQHSSFTFVAELPSPSKLDAFGNRSGANSDCATISQDRILNIFRTVGSSNERVVKHQEEPIATRSTPSPEDKHVRLSLSPETPENLVKREKSSSSSSVRSTPSRPLLSEDDQRRRSKSRSFENHKSRSRSPSPPPSNVEFDEHGQLARATMCGDKSYTTHPEGNANTVVDLLKKRLQYTNKKTFNDNEYGWVYAVRNPMLNLVKIGHTTVGDEIRFARMRRQCKLPHTVYIIKDHVRPEAQSLKAFRHLENLVHADLKPHRWYFECKCGLQFGDHFREHHEWYKISDEVAIQTIRLWRNFLQQNPYGELQQEGYYGLRDVWVQQLNQREPFPSDERHHHHEKRLQRWKKVCRLQSDASHLESPADISSSNAPGERMTIAPTQNILSEKQLSPPRVRDGKGSELSLSSEIVPSVEISVENVGEAQRGGTEVTSQILRQAAELVTSMTKGYLEPVPPVTALPSGRVDPTSTVEDRSADLPTGGSVRGQKDDQSVTNSRRSAQQSERPPGSTKTSEQDQYRSDENLSVGRVSDSDLNDFAAKLIEKLLQTKSGLPERSMYSDLIQFRWPIACSFVIALLAPHAPQGLAFATWLLFLPFFLAELRQWS